jgi:hypothetical protein
MPIQNPAGIRANTPTDDILESIREALAGFGGAAPGTVIEQVSINTGDITLQLGNPFYIGEDARFVGYTNGLKLEIRKPSGAWIEQESWEQLT